MIIGFASSPLVGAERTLAALLHRPEILSGVIDPYQGRTTTVAAIEMSALGKTLNRYRRSYSSKAVSDIQFECNTLDLEID